MKRHVNIPVFIPHLGCPNQCVFCNQRTISGVAEFDPTALSDIIDEALSTLGLDDDVEIAFFGGSFTGIDQELMISLLEIAHGYIVDGRVSSIRCSTRPDYINAEILEILRKFGVKTIELGLQSTSDDVLCASKRGHNFIAEERACKMIVDSGFELLGQMMIGLPGADLDSELQTADFIIACGAVAARIYPTVVFKDTELYDMSRSGVYTPLTLEDAVQRSAAVLLKFIEAGIDVIRIGLCSSDNLTSPETYYAGPNHSALGELVESRVYYMLIKNELKNNGELDGSEIVVLIPRGATSKAIGHKKVNKTKLLNEFSLKTITFKENDTISDYEVAVYKKDGEIKCT